MACGGSGYWSIYIPYWAGIGLLSLDFVTHGCLVRWSRNSGFLSAFRKGGGLFIGLTLSVGRIELIRIYTLRSCPRPPLLGFSQ